MSVEAISWAIREAPVTNPTDQLVLLVLAEHAQPDGTDAFPSTTTLMDETKLGRSTLFRTLTRLKDQGLIAAAGERGRGVVVYRLALTSPGAGPVPAAAPVPERDVTGPAAGPQPVPERDQNRKGNRQGTVQDPPVPPSTGRIRPGWPPGHRREGRCARSAREAADLRERAARLRAARAAAQGGGALPDALPAWPGPVVATEPPSPAVHAAPPPPSPEAPPRRRTLTELAEIRARALERHAAERAVAAT